MTSVSFRSIFLGRATEWELEHISWDDWFAKFDESALAFVYQTVKVNGDPSTFFTLISR